MALRRSFTSGGVTTVINPVNRLTGGTTSTFDKVANSGAYQKTLLLAAGATPVPALVVTAKNFLSHVKGGFGVDTISAEGDATTTGLDISLQLYPPVPGPFPQPFLHITAARIEDSASYNLVVPTLAGVDARAVISGLAIGGSLLHGVTLQYSGIPAQNHVLYQSPTMTITVNQRISAELISCTPKCVVTPVNISASAIGSRSTMPTSTATRFPAISPSATPPPATHCCFSCRVFARFSPAVALLRARSVPPIDLW
jgi:hypothetical protein